MPQASQLITSKPPAPDFGAGVSTAQDTESGENREFSTVLDDKVSQARAKTTPSETKSSDQSTPVSTAENKENGLQDNAAGGKTLPQQVVEAAGDIPVQDTVITALNDVSSHTDETGILQFAADASTVDGEDLLQTGSSDTPVIAPVNEDAPAATKTQAVDVEPVATVADETAVIPIPAATVNTEQGRAADARVASTVGLPNPVASGVANTNKGQTVVAQQTNNTSEEAEVDALLLSEGEQDESFAARQQEGEFSTKLRGLVDQVKRALGVNQNTTVNTATSQSNQVSHAVTPAMSSIQQTSDGAAIATQNNATTSINVGLKQEGWDEAMGQRVQWMVSKGIQKADVRLNPPNLGPLEVRVNMTDEGAEIRFISQHGVVRDSVESAMPRLREMLAEQGIDLANVDVSEHSIAQGNDQQDGDQQGTGENGRGLAAEDNGDQGDTLAANTRVSEGMLDLFA